MPEYLAPGVYVEEVSYRSKSIEGVSTTTTGFIGPARFGPLDMVPELVTSLGEFERIYGDGTQLVFNSAGQMDNFLWHAVRAFFEEGGKRLYISRVFKPVADDDTGFATALYTTVTDSDDDGVRVTARFPGSGGKVYVRFTLKFGQNVLSGTTDAPILNSVTHDDVVWVGLSADGTTKPTTGNFQRIHYDDASKAYQIKTYGDVVTEVDPDNLDEVRIVTLGLSVTTASGSTQVWSGYAPEPAHIRAGTGDALTVFFGTNPPNAGLARTLPVVLTAGEDVDTGLKIIQALFVDADIDGLSTNADIDLPASTLIYESVEALLDGGNDGERPTITEYEGAEDENTSTKTGLKAFEDLEDISILAAPGAAFGYETGDETAKAINGILLSHAQRMRYRIAVLECGNAQSISQVRAMRAKMDSTYGALYYPWVRVLDPVTRKEIYLPPAGFVAGIYARNDINRGVIKAPANEVVNLALGFEVNLNKSQQDVLNPEGVNCFRYFEGRGYRLWGARTISSDPEWKYVNLRRYFCYLERSIDKGTQWAVFEPNGEALWANVRRTIYDFLFNEWQRGALLGDKPENAFFVRCDRTTMNQNDLDNGRLVCLIGVAPLRPAEFVIFRIGQWTSDRKS